MCFVQSLSRQLELILYSFLIQLNPYFLHKRAHDGRIFIKIVQYLREFLVSKFLVALEMEQRLE